MAAQPADACIGAASTRTRRRCSHAIRRVAVRLIDRHVDAGMSAEGVGGGWRRRAGRAKTAPARAPPMMSQVMWLEDVKLTGDQWQ